MQAEGKAFATLGERLYFVWETKLCCAFLGLEWNTICKLEVNHMQEVMVEH